MTATVLSLVLALLAPKTEPLGPDPTAGRVEGDLSFVVGLGATVAPRAPRASAEFRARFLETGGLFLTYEDGFGGGSDPTRLLAGGVELRPLFLGRWLQGLELGHSFGDLLIDSLGLEIGAFASQPVGASLGDRAGLSLGLGVEVPLFARATGAWLAIHGGVRYSSEGLGGAADTALERAGFLTISLAWHQTIATHLVDAGDVAGR